MTHLLAGAIAMASITIALFFLRFWRASGDRFFLYFALSFAIEGLHRVYAVLRDGGLHARIKKADAAAAVFLSLIHCLF